MKKSELRQMIRECLQEELQKRSQSLTEDSLESGAKGGGTINQAYKSAGGAVEKYKNALEGKKTKIVKARDLKPGMTTRTGKIVRVTNKGWGEVEVSYGTIGAQGTIAKDEVSADREYEVLDEAFKAENEDEVFEGLFGFGKKKNKPATQTNTEPEEEVPAWPQWDEEGAQRIADLKRKDEMDRKMKRAYNNSLMDKIKGDDPSNTPYRGINYSGGDYY